MWILWKLELYWNLELDLEPSSGIFAARGKVLQAPNLKWNLEPFKRGTFRGELEPCKREP